MDYQITAQHFIISSLNQSKYDFNISLLTKYFNPLNFKNSLVTDLSYKSSLQQQCI